MNLEEKIVKSKRLIKNSLEKYKSASVACSFGKDSIAVVNLCRQIDENIPVFSILTTYKPKDTFSYLVKMNDRLNLNVTVYMRADKVPEIFNKNNIKTVLLPIDNYHKLASEIEEETGKKIYEINPDECCRQLKVEPINIAVKNLDAWFSGLRNTEGRTRKKYSSIEKKGNLVKINPILEFTEKEVFQYLSDNNIDIHPWYTKKFPDGKRYRSLGCAPCTRPIFDHQEEREGRWQNTSKCGGECGIHSQKF